MDKAMPDEKPASTKTGDARSLARAMVKDLDDGVPLGLAWRYACESHDVGSQVCFSFNMADQAKKMGLALTESTATETVLRALVKALP
jgi:hypothetical protein